MARTAIGVAALAFLVGAVFAQPSGQRAVGLNLPKKGLSFWKVGDRSAWGIEVNGSWITRTGAAPSETAVGDVDSESYFVNVGLTAQFFRPTEHRVKPFAASRVIWNRSGRYDENRKVYQMTGGNFGIGVGVAWEPWDRVGLWVRQYLSVDVHSNEWTRGGVGTDSFAVGYGRPEVTAFFMF